MTLANFNSNFNWQLRALQQAAECCGIIPDNVPPLPPVDCYFYGKLHDPSCFNFFSLSGDWDLNGVFYTTGLWPTLMQNPPYGTTGNAVQYGDPLSGCGSSQASDYYFWTVVPSTVLTLPPLTGTDPNTLLPVSVTMLGPICTQKCYEGTFRSVFGSIYLIGLNTAEINAPEYSMSVDLTQPTASLDLTNQLRQFYPSPPLNATVTIVGPDEYTIRIDGVYSLGTFILVYMDDFITVGTLNEIPC